jgi:hypothetical protein
MFGMLGLEHGIDAVKVTLQMANKSQATEWVSQVTCQLRAFRESLLLLTDIISSVTHRLQHAISGLHPRQGREG